MDQERPKTGQFYRHFKNKMYQITAVAVHSETGEEMVVYQALYGSFGTYVRPLSMFISPVDREKYPDVTQEYRFERVEMGQEEPVNFTEPVSQDPMPEKRGIQKSNENLLAFLDADTYYDKLEVLKNRKEKFSPEELLAICEIMEVGRADSEPEEKYYALERYLVLQNKYDGTRLR